MGHARGRGARAALPAGARARRTAPTPRPEVTLRPLLGDYRRSGARRAFGALRIDIERARRAGGGRQSAIGAGTQSSGHREDTRDLRAAGTEVKHPATTVLRSRRLVLVGSPGCVRGVPEANQMRRVLDGFACAREEHEEKDECGDAADPAHGAHDSRLVAKASATKGGDWPAALYCFAPFRTLRADGGRQKRVPLR